MGKKLISKGESIKDVKVEDKILMKIGECKTEEGGRSKNKRGKVLRICENYILVQHKKYRESYLVSDFLTGRITVLEIKRGMER